MVRQGEVGTEMYFVGEGSLEVRVYNQVGVGFRVGGAWRWGGVTRGRPWERATVGFRGRVMPNWTPCSPCLQHFTFCNSFTTFCHCPHSMYFAWQE